MINGSIQFTKVFSTNLLIALLSGEMMFFFFFLQRKGIRNNIKQSWDTRKQIMVTSMVIFNTTDSDTASKALLKLISNKLIRTSS
jgi:hypothetical protein